jgi:DNA polymerase-3 subunit alpha (Gram-positive type)
MITHLEVVYEMNKRGIELLPVDLYKSESAKFTVEGNAIRPPFSSVSGVGVNAAQSIAEVCKNTVFTSIEDFEAKTKANSAVVRALRDIGCLDRLPESAQLSLF